MVSEISLPQRKRVHVVPYDPAWPGIFEELSAAIRNAVRGLADSVEHVGSTSVPGLAAKPIIDIDVVVSSADRVPATIERLACLGYEHGGDEGIPGREAFISPSGLHRHHLYVCLQGSVALQNHLFVRDCLRNSPELAAAYGALKEELAERLGDDPAGYGAGKTKFLLALLAKAGVSGEVLRKIHLANSSKGKAADELF